MFAEPKSLFFLMVMIPLVSGLVCLFIVKFQSPIQIRKPSCIADASSTPKAFDDTLGVLSIADAYDSDRSILWENQVFALRRIGSHVTISELVDLWDRYQHLYPELYEQTTFSDWMAFLQNYGLVVSNGSLVRLTANGREFLKCLVCNADLSRAK